MLGGCPLAEGRFARPPFQEETGSCSAVAPCGRSAQLTQLTQIGHLMEFRILGWSRHLRSRVELKTQDSNKCPVLRTPKTGHFMESSFFGKACVAVGTSTIHDGSEFPHGSEEPGN